MPRSEDAHVFFSAVYEAIQEIPHGRVTSYAHIARLIGKPRNPRQVGVCLKHLPSEDSNLELHSGNVPWQRVINSKGMISPRGPDGAARQAAKLRREGVEVEQNSMGEYLVSFQKYGWFPDVLPSEEGLQAESSENESESSQAEQS